MDLQNEITDIISTLQEVERHYDTILEELSDTLAGVKLENILLQKQNQMLSQKIDALAKHLSVKLEQPDTRIRAVKMDDSASNN
jgi:uncharacterized protein YoxC